MTNTNQRKTENTQWLKEQLAELDNAEVLTITQGLETLVQLLSIHDTHFGKTLSQVLMKISLVMTSHFAEMGDNDEGVFLGNYTCMMELLQELATQTSELDVQTLNAAGRKLGIEVY
ncbi:MAG TPA: hypothetical protein DCS93_04275 [Microscillaceae bacterium]|nr:hypothetical protein [Microscillaceae bacterium]